ncbi:MAG: alpha/beta hydrolase [Paracoccaceae bacterium]|nr:alpha/beta hydrolase [Paracoccaceae bacterium]
MKNAPLYASLAEAPEGGKARWIEAADGVRLRVACWQGGENGTILLFPGRTEFVEKYGRVVTDLVAAGYSVAVIDWRGQGLSDRLTPNRALGHVERFTDFQMDVAAMLNHVRQVALPKPWFLLAHSMGGAIALRALHEGLPVERVVFTAPMWGLSIDPLWRPMVQAVAVGGSSVGFGQEFAPGTSSENYLRTAAFEGNSLTTSEDTWNYLQRIVSSRPGLEIGGPSIQWLSEALAETRELMKMDPPDFEALTLVGSLESVIDRKQVIEYMERWPHSLTTIVTGARHEVLMEAAAVRKRALGLIDVFYKS